MDIYVRLLKGGRHGSACAAVVRTKRNLHNFDIDIKEKSLKTDAHCYREPGGGMYRGMGERQFQVNMG